MVEKLQYPGSVAFLGPEGTHSDLALSEYLPNSRRTSCQTLADVFLAVERNDVEAGFVPLENMLQGPIAETLDLLLQYKDRIYIAGGHTAQIAHGLGVFGKPNQQKEDFSYKTISDIYSRQQAFEQSQEFLRKNLSHVTKHPVESTASGVEIVAKSSSSSFAVIASPVTLRKHGLTVLVEDISDSNNNKTRFVLVKKGGALLKEVSGFVAGEQKGAVTSIAILPGRDRQGLLHDILRVISVEHGVNLLSIHSRPDGKGGFLFYLDLEGHIKSNPISQCLSALQEYLNVSTGNIASLVVFGCYECLPFFKPLLNKICIIGGKGAMGEWFESFFKNAGLSVQIIDRDSSVSLGDTVKDCDVVFLSVPIAAIPEIATAISNCIGKNTLVVENCSVKENVLSTLESSLPKNVEILGIHTMFGPSAESLFEKNVIVTKTASSGKRASAFTDLLYKYGARLTYASVDEHDELAAFVQSLIHLILISLNEVATDNNVDPAKLNAFHTPNSRAIFEAADHILSLNPNLLADLQLKNPKAGKLRRQFLETYFMRTMELAGFDQVSFLAALKKEKP